MHPFVNVAIRLQLRELGYNTTEIRNAMRRFSSSLLRQAINEARTVRPNDVIPAVVQTALLGSVVFQGDDVSSPGETGAFGDGSIIEAIIRFFDSPIGQLIMQLIMTLLIV